MNYIIMHYDSSVLEMCSKLEAFKNHFMSWMFPLMKLMVSR